MIFPLFVFAIIGGIMGIPAEDPAYDGDHLDVATFGTGKYSVKGLATYMNAIQICQENGMRLVQISNQQESDEVTYYVEKTSAIRGPFFTAASRQADGETWAFPNGTPVKYFNWAYGEPNNADGNEQCVEIYKNGQWNDISCSKLRYALCESV